LNYYFQYILAVFGYLNITHTTFIEYYKFNVTIK